MTDVASKKLAAIDAGDTGPRLWSANPKIVDEALRMRFVDEASDGSLTDEHFARYVELEYGFVQLAARLWAAAVQRAPSFDPIPTFAGNLFALTHGQIAFFRRAFEHLGRAAPAVPPTDHALGTLATALIRHGSYVEVITTLFAAESLYYLWCETAEPDDTVAPVLAEWIDLHATDAFVQQVAFLGNQLDVAGNAISEDNTDTAFQQCLRAEIDFHSHVYGSPG